MPSFFERYLAAISQPIGTIRYFLKIIISIRESGAVFQLTAMGTIIETKTFEEALEIIKNAYLVLVPYSERIYSTVCFDIQKNKENRLKSKVESIENKIGKIA